MKKLILKKTKNYPESIFASIPNKLTIAICELLSKEFNKYMFKKLGISSIEEHRKKLSVMSVREYQREYIKTCNYEREFYETEYKEWLAKIFRTN